jgi:predicted ribosomally synthesized peptide with SipW-like signal peptide
MLSIAAVGAAAAIAGLGTYATFTSSTSANQTVSSGTVTIALGPGGSATNRLTVGASNIAAGDTIQRAADLVNTSSVAMSSVTLTTTASPTSALDTDTTNGLQMVIDECSNAWTEAGTAPAYTYTCSGTTTSVLATRAVIGSAIALNGMNIASAGTDHLRVTLTLPSASNLQGLSSTITYNFTGTQRAATNG